MYKLDIEKNIKRVDDYMEMKTAEYEMLGEDDYEIITIYAITEEWTRGSHDPLRTYNAFHGLMLACVMDWGSVVRLARSLDCDGGTNLSYEKMLRLLRVACNILHEPTEMETGE